jgi:hypothetical protein
MPRITKYDAKLRLICKILKRFYYNITQSSLVKNAFDVFFDVTGVFT